MKIIPLISRIILVIALSLFFTSCSSGGGGDDTTSITDTTSTVDGTTDTTDEITTDTATDGINSAIYESISRGVEEDIDVLIDEACPTVGGVALFTGIDTNANGELDIEERVGDPQIVCNGTSELSTGFTAEDLATGDTNCPLGGIKLQTTSSTIYLCNESGTLNAADFTQTGSISGTLNIDTLTQSPSRNLAITSRTVTSMSGGLWLTPAGVNAAVQEDKKANSLTAQEAIPEPITKPLEVTIEADNSYNIPDVPSGEYSLIYVDEVNTQGTKLDNISVAPAQEVVQDIEQIDIKTNGSVTFKVASLTIGSEIENATIRLNELDSTTTSDADGSAGFSDLPEGTYSLTVSQDGYVSKYITFTITSGQETNLQTIELNNKKGALVGSVEADVVDDYANIIVYAKSADGSIFTSLTDSNGNYNFVALPVGDGYSVLAYAHDFESSKVDNITIREAQTSSANTIMLTKNVRSVTTGSITGFARFNDVNDALNHAGIIVSIEGTSYEAITSRDGSFILNNILAGEYTLNFTDSNHETQTQSVKVIAGSTTILDNVELIAKVGNLTGIVVDELGESVADAYITLTTPSQTLTTVSDSDGSYTLNGILAGSYEVIASKDGYGAGSSFVSIVQNETLDISTSSPIALSRKLLTGTINLQNTTANEGATVSLTGTDIANATTDTTGNFTLYGVGAGNYQLQITKVGYITQTIPLSITSDDGYALPYTIELELAQGTIGGIATLTNKISHLGIKVEVLGTDYFTYTDAAGKWAIDVAVGNYSGGIKFSKALFDTTTVEDTATIVENGSYSVSSVSLTQISQNLTGTVSVNGESDFSATTIAITGSSGDASGVTATLNPQVDGSISVENLPLGTYSYTITYPDGLHESILSSFTLDGTLEVFNLGEITLRTSYVTINNNALYTNSKDVTLSIGNSDAAEMEIVEGGITSTKEPIVSSKSFTLSDGDGNKTLEVKLYDSQGVALPSVTDSIILDTTLNVSNFTLSGATQKGDTLKISLTLGESDASVSASIAGIINGLILLDNGTGGDTTADDGIYERTLLITTPAELNLVATTDITDRAGNTNTTATSNTLAISTAPSIENITITSNVANQSMSISFTTDEPTTSSIEYGVDTTYGTNADITTSLSTNHSITLNNLTANTITYFQIEVKDEALNTSSFASQGKLAPPPPANFSLAPGNDEVGLVWDAVTTDGVIGYNIYRSDDNITFIQLNTTLITDTYYLDALAFNDTTYSYKLTTVDDNANESEQTAAISTTPLSSLAGPTEVTGGVIDTNTIWLSSRSPYNITADMKVDADRKLLLLAGTTVNLSGDNRYILVEGTLNGYGSAQNPIEINITNFTESTDSGGTNTGGYIKIDGEGVTLEYVNINNAGFNKINGNITLNYANVTVNTCTSNSYFEVTQVNDSNITETKNNFDTSECNGHSLQIETVNRSVFEYTGNQLIVDTNTYSYYNGIYLSNVVNFNNSSFSDGRIWVNQEAIVANSSLQNIYIEGDSITIENSIIDKSYISAYSIILHYNQIINLLGLGSYDGANDTWTVDNVNISSNYWGTTNLDDILALTNYSPSDTSKLYPIISSADIFNADFDNDGLPDYIDNDNDNDGYSDLQEDKESDPQFGSIYNPLDANSHPSSDFDNDYDGTKDSEDDDDDNDGLSDTEEGNYQTNPMIADSDGDGVSDGDEITYKYDPLDKDNYPLTNSRADIIIDNSNVNSDGIVYMVGSQTLTNISILAGTKITIEKDTQVTIKDSTITGTQISPIVIRSSNVGNGNLRLENTNLAYANINLLISMYTDSSSFISYSDIFSSGGQLDGIIENSSIFSNFSLGGKLLNSYISTSIDFTNYIDNTIILADKNYFNGSISNMSPIAITNSYLQSASFMSAVNIDTSIVEGLGENYSASSISNSDTIFLGGGTYNYFFDSSFIQDSADNNYTELGSPEDTTGDGVAETEFDIAGITYIVDGITNPRSIKNFPDWVSDPAIKQYFWDPTNVGCLWDKNNPDIFPEP